MKKLFTIICIFFVFVFTVKAGDTLRLHLNSNPLQGGVKLRNMTTAVAAEASNFYTLQAKIGDVLWIMSSDAATISVVFDSKPAGVPSIDLDCEAFGSYVFTFDVLGNYVFHVSQNGTNLKDADKITISVITTGINDESAINVPSMAFPNPFQGEVTIEHAQADAIHIYNILGKVVASYNLVKSDIQTTLDLSNIPSGVYFYKIMNDGAVIDTKRIIKQ